MDDAITGYHVLSLFSLGIGVPFLMLGLNGPLKVLRWRHEGTRVEGTIVRALRSQVDVSRNINTPDMRDRWCAVYRYTMPDGRTFESAITHINEWRKKESQICIGENVPLFVLPQSPEKVWHAGLPLFDSGDRLLFVLGLAGIVAALPFWPKSAAATLALIGIYFALRAPFLFGPHKSRKGEETRGS